MTASRIKSGVLFALMACFAAPALAQTGGEGTALPGSPDTSTIDMRDASFLPTPLVPQDNSATAATTGTSGAIAATPPVSLPAATPPQASASAPLPVSSPPAAPATATVPAAPTAAALSSGIVGNPVESTELQTIGPDSIGVLTSEGGGLGAGMWKGTPRELIDRLLPELALPTSSPTLNGLAARFLLTTANIPDDKDGDASLTAARIEKLVALGDAADAWKLAQLAKPDQVDEATLRLVTEAALVSPASKDVCAKLPDIIKTHNTPEWQESLVTCQLMSGDAKAAQLGLDVLRAQDLKDEAFFQLADHNIVGGSKSLPRQLTPLKPLDLALLRLMDRPLPNELYSHPEAPVIPELLKTTARDENSRLSLAERAAARGIIGSAQLGDVYRSIAFQPDELSGALGSQESGPKLRALLYQAMQAEKAPQNRYDEAIKFMRSMDAGAFSGAAAQLLASAIGGDPPGVDQALQSAAVARIFIMAGKPKEALPWFKLARKATGAPDVVAQLQDLWPLAVLGGVETGDDYGKDFSPWLDTALKDAGQARREQVGSVLLLFEAAGFAVQESAWAHVVDLPSNGRHVSPLPGLLIERLRMAGAGNRRGETVLLALAIAGADAGQFTLLPAVETVQALRMAGLAGDSMALARESAALMLAPSDTPGKL